MEPITAINKIKTTLIATEKVVEVLGDAMIDSRRKSSIGWMACGLARQGFFEWRETYKRQVKKKMGYTARISDLECFFSFFRW